ncbi:MAG TPA: GNAT family N-acetyltransferase [Spirochaetota bacterium]|nr:GNAT family N-acetyltransferase [Spirochaetota bacterium]HPQ55235.1 GNAT family N-acetyltransferase [Spirochaetota bacterium]
MEIRRIQEHEITAVQAILPEQWNSNLTGLYRTYRSSDSFQPLVAVDGGTIAAYGQALIFGDTAWLGSISVKRECRRRGIGMRITEELIDRCYAGGAGSIHLMATDAGEPLYRKLGFVDDTLYLFYSGRYHGPVNRNILPIEERDRDCVLDISRRVTGEERDSILDAYLSSGYKYRDDAGTITGFFLPAFGNGLVLAMDDTTGMELLKYKHSMGGTLSVLSEENESGVDFLEAMDFRRVNSSKRMYLGACREWYPDKTFSRGATYAG